jgi:hypothetical protein
VLLLLPCNHRWMHQTAPAAAAGTACYCCQQQQVGRPQRCRQLVLLEVLLLPGCQSRHPHSPLLLLAQVLLLVCWGQHPMLVQRLQMGLQQQHSRQAR